MTSSLARSTGGLPIIEHPALAAIINAIAAV
jgi:hypothetical protein